MTRDEWVEQAARLLSERGIPVEDAGDYAETLAVTQERDAEPGDFVDEWQTPAEAVDDEAACWDAE